MLLLTLRETHALSRLSSFKKLRRTGGKFDHRPGRPKVLLRHWLTVNKYAIVRNYIAVSDWSASGIRKDDRLTGDISLSSTVYASVQY